jgi:hypothetical protein
VILILKQRNEAWVLCKVEIGLDVQFLHWETQLVDIFPGEEGRTGQVEEYTLFLLVGLILAYLFGFSQIHK